MCAVVRSYVAANRMAIGMHISALKLGGKKKDRKTAVVDAKRAAILVDLTDVAPRHEVYVASAAGLDRVVGAGGVARSSGPGASNRVLLEVNIQLGRRQVRRALPFTYDASYFAGSLGL